MNRKKIDSAQYADDIAKALKKGVFLTTKADEKVNSMVNWMGTYWQDLGTAGICGVCA